MTVYRPSTKPNLLLWGDVSDERGRGHSKSHCLITSLRASSILTRRRDPLWPKGGVYQSGEQHALLALLHAAGPEAERTYGATVMGTPEYYNMKDYNDYSIHSAFG